jgi:hypothetical protein
MIQSWISVLGEILAIASGKPLRPSIEAIKISSRLIVQNVLTTYSQGYGIKAVISSSCRDDHNVFKFSHIQIYIFYKKIGMLSSLFK